MCIIDKDKNALGKLTLADFEQWFDKKELTKIMENNGLKVSIKENLKYKNKQDGLFNAWLGLKKI